MHDRRELGGRTWARTAAGLAAGIAGLVLAGWAFDVDALKRVYPNAIAMNPVTAIAFLLLSACVWRTGWVGAADGTTRRMAAVVAGIGVWRLINYAIGSDFMVDRLLFPSKLMDGGLPNRMAMSTAGSFVALGTALLFWNEVERRRAAVVEGLVLLALLNAFLAVIGHAYGVSTLYTPFPSIGMAAHTALSFVMLGTGILASRPERGVAAVISSPNAGGLAARQLIPAAVLLPLLLGWARLLGHEKGFFPSVAAGVATLVTGFILCQAAMIIWTARRLDVMDEELLAFSYSVSHDLRTPVRHVDAFAGLLRAQLGDKLDPESGRLLEGISRSAQRMSALIEGLLALSQVDRAELRLSVVDLNALAREVIDDLPLGRRDVRWRLEALPAVECDRTLVRQVLANLLGNALKFTAGKEPADISLLYTGTRDGFARFEIRDNGAGFDPRYAHKLFGTFQRLHSEDEFEGTGIGLATAAKIVRKHGGEVRAEGKVGEGAAFFFSLPAAVVAGR